MSDISGAFDKVETKRLLLKLKAAGVNKRSDPTGLHGVNTTERTQSGSYGIVPGRFSQSI